MRSTNVVVARATALLGLAALFLMAPGCGGKESSDSGSSSPPAAENKPVKEVEVRRVDAATVGSVSGVVQVTGDVPPPGVTEMRTEAFCKNHHGSDQIPDASLMVENGNVANVLVWIKDGLEGYEFDPPAEAPVLDQKGCVFSPRVVAVRAGHELTVLNSDPILHNVHTKPKLNRQRNIAFPRKGMTRPFKFQQVEVLPVTCDVHPWMLGYIGVVDSPFYAVTGTDGAFQLDGVPPGDYTLAIWHEVLGTKDVDITVDTKQQVVLDPVVMAIP